MPSLPHFFHSLRTATKQMGREHKLRINMFGKPGRNQTKTECLIDHAGQSIRVKAILLLWISDAIVEHRSVPFFDSRDGSHWYWILEKRRPAKLAYESNAKENLASAECTNHSLRNRHGRVDLLSVPIQPHACPRSRASLGSFPNHEAPAKCSAKTHAHWTWNSVTNEHKAS